LRSGGAFLTQQESNRLHRRLGSFGVLLLTLSCLSPVVSINANGSDVLLHAGTGAAATFVCGIGAAVVWAIVYAELGSAYPYAGGDYVGVGSILGPWAGFGSLTIWGVTSGPAMAFIAKTIPVYFNVLVPGASPPLVTFVAVAAATGIALLAVRTSALVTGIFLAIEMLAVFILIGAGLWHPVRSLSSVILHPVMLGTTGALGPATVGALALAAITAAYATTGGNQAIGFGEELIEPHRRMGRVILLAGVIGGLTTALPVIAVVIGAKDLPLILNSPAPFSTFVASVAGPLAARALSAGVILAMFNCLIAGMMFYGRLYYSLGRDGIFNPTVNSLLARVHGRTGAPRIATWAVTAYSGACCLLNAHLLLVFIAGATVYLFALVSTAVLVGRMRGLTGQAGYWRSPLFPLAPVLGLVLALVFFIADLLDEDAGRPSLLVLGGVIGVGLAWHHLVLRRRAGGWAPQVS
jgi:amino acid transporter